MTRRRWIGGWHRAVACVMLAALFVAAATVPARADDDAVPDELIVGLQESVSAERAEAVYQAEGASRLERVRRLNVDRIRLHGDTRDAVAQRLRSRPEVAFVERNRRVPPAFTPNDPLFTSQWHLPAIASPQAWDVTTGSPAVIIAVLDSGVDASHPDLAGQLVPGWNFYSDDGDTSDVFGHGTLVAGVAAAIGNNGIGVAGVAMQSRIMPVRVTDATGSALFSTMASAITWAADHGARVLNISFADVATSAAITSAADYARSRGALVVAAAGNCGCLDDSPANPSIISVSATAPGDALALWSTQGSIVDLAAPGVGIYTTARGGGYSTVSGTSFSSPIVAGVAALVMAANPALTSTQVEQVLRSTADDLGPTGWDPGYGDGRVNAFRAVSTATVGASLDTQAPSAAITAPAGGTVSGSVAVAVSASDNVGVTRVELWLDGALLASRTSPPWAFTWDSTATANGSHRLTARAYDAAGNVGASAPLGVTVSNAVADTQAPTVAIVSPSGGTVSRAVPVAVSASDNVRVTRVELWVDGARVATATTPPWTIVWDSGGMANGSHTLAAKAYDAAGNVGTSTPVGVIVSNRSLADAPAVSIALPTPSTIGVSASDSSLSRLELWVDGTRLSTRTAAPWSLTQSVSALSSGEHTLMARASDAAGNITTVIVSITVSHGAVAGAAVTSSAFAPSAEDGAGRPAGGSILAIPSATGPTPSPGPPRRRTIAR